MKNLMTFAVLVALALPAAAQNVVETPHAGYRETGAARDWVGIYSPDRGGASSCAIYSRPTASAAFDASGETEMLRGELAAFLSWNAGPVSVSAGEISFLMGAALVQGAGDHRLLINGEFGFDLIAVEDRLYVKPEDDAEVIRQMRAGREMVVTGKSVDGRTIKDTYSLFGVQRMTEISADECR